MKHALKSSLFAMMFLLSLPGSALLAQTADMVTFEATPIQPSKFKLKKAKAKGITLEPTPGITLKGQLFHPGGDGPFPAVIVLLSGDGLQASHVNWSKSLAERGFVALLVDSFASRGGSNFQDTPAMNMPDDAISAHRFLSPLPYVEKPRIGFLGFSLGASHLFTVLNPTYRNAPEGFRVAAAAAIYPVCPPDGAVIAPMLILAGDNDDLMSLAPCEAFSEQSANTGALTTLHVLKGATHFFDNPNYSKTGDRDGPPPLWFETNHYDERAHQQALQMVMEHFDALLKDSD